MLLHPLPQRPTGLFSTPYGWLVLTHRPWEEDVETIVTELGGTFLTVQVVNVEGSPTNVNGHVYLPTGEFIAVHHDRYELGPNPRLCEGVMIRPRLSLTHDPKNSLPIPGINTARQISWQTIYLCNVSGDFTGMILGDLVKYPFWPSFFSLVQGWPTSFHNPCPTFENHPVTFISRIGKEGSNVFSSLAKPRNKNDFKISEFRKARHAAWSPDLSKIAVTHKGAVSIMDPQHKTIRTFPIPGALHVAWAADGMTVAFTINNGDDTYQFCVIDLE